MASLTQSNFEALAETTSGSKTGTLQPGVYRVVLVGGSGGNGGRGSHDGGAGGAGGRLTYNFTVNTATSYTLSAGAKGTDGESRYVCGSVGGICDDKAYCGRGGTAGTKSSFAFGATTLTAGGGGGGGGAGSYVKHGAFCASTTKYSGSAGSNASSPGGAGGASCSNCAGSAGTAGGTSPASNVSASDVQTCTGPCAKLYKLKS
jgi:hypothetical protein